MRTLTCFAGVVLATGCAASPPVRARVGGTYHPTPVEYHGVEPGTTASASGVASTSIGLHAASAAELPFDVGVGVMTDFYRAGYYLEGAALRRIRPWLRVGATGAAEYWAAGERGLGGRAGVTAEWTSKPRAYSETETVKCTTSHAAVGGVWAIGLYLEAGYRAMFDEKNAVSINMGLSVRWPAFAVIVYPESLGGSSCE